MDELAGQYLTCLKAFSLVILIAGLLILTSATSVATYSPGIAVIDCNRYVSAVVMDDGSLWTWGGNFYGFLGTGNRNDSCMPVNIEISDVKSVCVGYSSVVALTGDGTIWSWGNDIESYENYPATGGFPKSLKPVRIGRIEGAKSIAATYDRVIVLKSDGTVMDLCWSENTTIQVPITGVISIDAGIHHAVALKSDGTVWSWGDGSDGQMGNGVFSGSAVPAQALITGVAAISCGNGNTLALKSEGTVWGWGDNTGSKLGNWSSDISQAIPVRVETLQGIVAISNGDSHSLALKSDGTVWAWGRDYNEGIMGNGQYSGAVPIVDPVRVTGLENILQISAGATHSLALRGDGSLWAWGRDAEGELGSGNVTGAPDGIVGQAVPVQVLIGPPASLPASVTQKLPGPGSQPPSPSLDGIPVLGSGGWNASRVNWEVNVGGSPLAIGLVTDDVVYAYRGNDIYCIGLDGRRRWNVTIPAGWNICFPRSVLNYPMASGGGSAGHIESQPIMCADDGFLYIYAPPYGKNNTVLHGRGAWMNVTCAGGGWDVIAIAPDGKIAWSVPLDTSVQEYDDTSLYAKNGLVYAFHSYNLTVIDRDGSVLLTMPGASDPCAVDESGNLYYTPATSRNWFDADYREPTDVVESRYPNGTLRWRKYLGEGVVRQFVSGEAKQEYGTLPLYWNDSLYVPVRHGIVVLDTNGNEKWARHFDDGLYKLLGIMPIDSAGNIYMVNAGDDYNTFGRELPVYVIGPDNHVSAPRSFVDYGNGPYCQYDAKDGVVYTATRVYDSLEKSSLDDLDTFVLSAYDLKNGKYLWNYSLPTGDKHLAIITRENAAVILGPLSDEVSYGNMQGDAIVMASYRGISSLPIVRIYAEGDKVYIQFMSITFETPVVYGESKCIYTSGIFAVDASGRASAGQQLDTPVTSIAVNNGTIFFIDGDGKITSVIIGITSGVVILAAIIFTLKFFVFGYVSRARSLVDKNENRNRVMGFVAANPGSTMHDLSRSLGMNIGTVRYHLMILGINHRLASYRDGAKRIRYFANAGSFSGEQMKLISLLRRKTVSKLLRTLSGTDGMTNSRLSVTSRIPDSDVSRLLKELTSEGIIVRVALPGEKPVYRIAPGLEGHIADIIRQIDTQRTGSPAIEMSLA